MASIDNNFTFADASFPSFLDDDLAAISGMKKRVEAGMACESGAVVGSSDGTASAAERENELSGSFGGFSCGRRPTAAVGGLGERVAARAGFSAPRLNTARVRLGDGALASPRGARSPCLTIPPGLSPTTLLDSPVFLFNSQAQPSPTTGAFPLPSLSQRNDSTITHTTRVSAAAGKEQRTCEQYSDSSFAFKPHVGGPVSCFQSSGNQASSTIQEPSWSRVEDAFLPKPFIEAQNAAPKLLFETQAEGQHQNESYNQADSLTLSSGESNIKTATSDTQASVGIICSEQSPPTEDHLDDDGDKETSFAPASVGVSSEDGYNWRKYGQKQVKSSEFPRSYYKCTHTNCQVRKKIERAHDGHITEIIYKGAHNHPKPPPSRRSLGALAAIEDAVLDRQDQGLHETAESQPVWKGNQLETAAGSQDWKADSSEMTSLAPSTDFCNQSISAQSRSFGHHEMTDAPEISSTLSGGDDDDEMATNFSMSLGDEGDEDELESKRRKKDGCAVDAAMTSRGIREPRVVVQTTSEVDILDDGYRWRKYGQKVVKGNPNPRSYYKCTSPGCPVRKHVERASHDLKSVITTYEGKHNHDVPAARSNTGSNHLTSTTSSMGTAPASSSHILKPEPVPQQNNIMRFNNLHERLSMPSLPGFGPANTPQMGQSLYSGLSSFPLNQQMGLGNFKFSGLPIGHEKLGVGPYLMQHKLTEVAPPSRLPGELKEEPVFESGMPGTHGSLYHQIMGTLPLGPQM
ncbi:probable WRKY transcription factor 34 [Nymphaea colorata]|nr:probable WRKY transcription factor 34 [Nymphaea colorata]